MNFIERYQHMLRKAMKQTAFPGRNHLQDLPVQKQLLYQKITSDPFDGGHTVRWLSQIQITATWKSIHDSEYGHTIHVVSDRSESDIMKDISKGFHILRWLTKQPIVWFWWDHSWERILPGNTLPARDHINGGWAIPGISEVHVYRREEAHKVLIHEVIHAIQLDIPHSHIPPILHMFETDIGKKLWPHLGEAYTEFYAAFLWSIYISTSDKDAYQNWKYQMKCSTKQARQIWARIHHSREAENTNVFAYYILKWVLMQHTPEVLLSPQGSLHHWFRWWKELQPTLTVKKDYQSIKQNLSVGMTCDVESR